MTTVNRSELPGSDVACETLDVRDDAHVGGALTVDGAITQGGVPVVSGLQLQNAGVPLAGGPWTTLNLTGLVGSAGGGAGVASVVASGASMPGMFGSGIDGAFTFDGATTFNGSTAAAMVPVANVYTLSRDIYLAGPSQVNFGVVIKTAGFRIFCNGVLTVNGTIHCDGGDGGNAPAGSSGGGAAGVVAQVSAFYANTNPGIAGGAAGSTGTSGATSPSLAPLGGTNFGPGPGASGTSLNGGGGGSGTNVGGSGGACAAYQPATSASWDHWLAFWTGRGPKETTSGVNTGAAGGSGGGGAAGNNAGGGGSGAPGGVVGLFARQLLGTGTIRAKGGNGGNGGTAGGQNTGGGGGGSGGAVGVITMSIAGTLTVSANGGTGGAGSGTGANGGNGGAGQVRIFLFA